MWLVAVRVMYRGMADVRGASVFPGAHHLRISNFAARRWHSVSRPASFLSVRLSPDPCEFPCPLTYVRPFEGGVIIPYRLEACTPGHT